MEITETIAFFVIRTQCRLGKDSGLVLNLAVLLECRWFPSEIRPVVVGVSSLPWFMGLENVVHVLHNMRWQSSLEHRCPDFHLGDLTVRDLLPSDWAQYSHLFWETQPLSVSRDVLAVPLYPANKGASKDSSLRD